MNTNITPGQLAQLYNISRTTFHVFLKPHREKLLELATWTGKRRSRIYNTAQLSYIINTIFQNPPLRYSFDGHSLVPIKEEATL